MSVTFLVANFLIRREDALRCVMWVESRLRKILEGAHYLFESLTHMHTGLGIPDRSQGTPRPMVRQLHLAGLIGKSHFCGQSRVAAGQLRGFCVRGVTTKCSDSPSGASGNSFTGRRNKNGLITLNILCRKKMFFDNPTVKFQSQNFRQPWYDVFFSDFIKVIQVKAMFTV